MLFKPPMNATKAYLEPPGDPQGTRSAQPKMTQGPGSTLLSFSGDILGTLDEPQELSKNALETS